VVLFFKGNDLLIFPPTQGINSTCLPAEQLSKEGDKYMVGSKGIKSRRPEKTMVKIGLAIYHLCNKAKLSDIEELFNATGRSLVSH